MKSAKNTSIVDLKVSCLTAIRSRQSIRQFLTMPVPVETVRAILDDAKWAPSGTNTQPWRVVVVTGETKKQLSDALLDLRQQNAPSSPDYFYYPQNWREPYLSRRRECGLALYQSIHIEKHEIEKRLVAWNRNYTFFDAPVGLIFFIEKKLEKGSWLDCGMFIQNVMLAAMGHGLGTCPQASIAEYPDTVRNVLNVSNDWHVICGMALGYPDFSAEINQYRTSRVEVDEFTSWMD